MTERADVVIVGAGAAGLMTTIALGRGLESSGERRRAVLVDGAKKIGAKILVAGGGRCNVTHHAIDHRAYAGSSPGAVKSVLKRWSVGDTVAFFAGLGVELKRERTGKLFPVTDKAQTVLSALLGEIGRLASVGVELRHPWRAVGFEQDDDGFVVRGAGESIAAERVVLATGGRALPRSGSDGAGYAFATAMGHTITPDVRPSLVPIKAGERSAWLTELPGVSCRAGVEVCDRSPTGLPGKRIARFDNDLLCTHFGLSGPAVMDASRYLEIDGDTTGRVLVIDWLGDASFDAADAALRDLGRRPIVAWLRDHLLPDRLARALCRSAGVDPATPGTSLTKDARRRLAHALTTTVVDVVGDRGWHHAETTAGGVPMSEVDPKTMRSRATPGLHLVGEVLDVDGRIGGFNFQWAWATGSICGAALADALDAGPISPSRAR
ncbi:MAG: aminoacetone oxidase family FAD-binding enzyme [Planctomycetota bacterium]